MDASIIETVLAYVEGDDDKTALVYAATLSPEGLSRSISNLSAALDLLIDEERKRKEESTKNKKE